MGTNSTNGKLYGYAFPGRFGLGHSLLAWARCSLWCTDNDVPMIAPRWLYFRLGPYLRRERDKRSYHTLFTQRVYVRGARRLWLLRTATRFTPQQEQEARTASGTRMLVFENDDRDNTRHFRTLYGRHEEVRRELLRIARPEHIPARNAKKPFIGIHVRMGDFTRVSNASALSTTSNVQLPVEWYREILLALRKKAGSDLDARVFSDGDAESLRPLLDLPRVSLVTPRSALYDILALSQAAALISSGSGFSMWAAYLGQAPRICFPGQRREYVVVGDANLEPECGTADEVPLTFFEHLTITLQPGEAALQPL